MRRRLTGVLLALLLTAGAVVGRCDRLHERQHPRSGAVVSGTRTSRCGANAIDWTLTSERHHDNGYVPVLASTVGGGVRTSSWRRPHGMHEQCDYSVAASSRPSCRRSSRAAIVKTSASMTPARGHGATPDTSTTTTKSMVHESGRRQARIVDQPDRAASNRTDLMTAATPVNHSLMEWLATVAEPDRPPMERSRPTAIADYMRSPATTSIIGRPARWRGRNSGRRARRALPGPCAAGPMPPSRG